MQKPIRLNIRVPKEDLRILCIGDCHFPFQNKKQVKEIVKIAKDFQPTFIVQVGDAYDMYSYSRFAKSVDYISPKKELLLGKQQIGEFWGDLGKASPKARKLQLRGNHCERVEKGMLTKAPEFEAMLERPIQQLLEFDGVTDLKSSKSELSINDIVFVHGWSSNKGAHAKYFLKSVVCGHSHRGYVEFESKDGKPIFELNCGHIANTSALPMLYRETLTSKWVAGCGLIDQYGPRFVCL